MTTNDILKQLQLISKKHLHNQPKLAMDSLVLALNISLPELRVQLHSLSDAGFISIEGNYVSLTMTGLEAIV